jgi:hypothetical protein
MAGERDIRTLLASLTPELMEGEFVFCTFKNAAYGEYAELQPLASISEKEGLTLVIPRSIADAYTLRYESVFSCISLTVHSSLDAVGLTAALSNTLAAHRISANVIAGYYHDHIFVQRERAETAIAALAALAACPPLDE